MNYIVCSKKAYKNVGSPPPTGDGVRIIIKPYLRRIISVQDDIIGRELSDEEVIKAALNSKP